MLTLLVVKENLKVFYSKYSTILNISIKFVLALICLLIINYNIYNYIKYTPVLKFNIFMLFSKALNYKCDKFVL